MSEFCKLTVEILVDSVETFLQLLLSQLADRIVSGVVVNIGQKDGLGEWRPYVFPGASVTVPTSSNLVQCQL